MQVSPIDFDGRISHNKDMSDTVTSIPVATDLALAAAHGVLFEAQRKVSIRKSQIRNNAGHRKVRLNGEMTYPLPFSEAVAFVVSKGWTTDITNYDAAIAALRDAEEVVEELNELYTGWSRFFLVNNTGGHIHSSTSCSTCRIDTSFSWLPELSGLTELDAVTEYGQILCSVCFPSAPSEWTTGVSKATQVAREASAAAKLERDAKKLAKALLPDGSALGVGASISQRTGRTMYESELVTFVAARNWLIEKYRDERYYGPSTPTQVADMAMVAAAIAAKTGKTVAEVESASRASARK